MKIDVKRAAQLSKLNISDNKAKSFEKQMNDIAQMISVLSQINNDISDTDERRAELRADQPHEQSLSQQQIMQNAPAFSNGVFCVPKTVD